MRRKEWLIQVSSNISEKELDELSCTGSLLVRWRLYAFSEERAKSMLTDTRNDSNEARLVFPHGGWGPKYPSSRGLILLQFAYLHQSCNMPKRLSS